MSLQRCNLDLVEADLPRHIQVLLDETAEAVNAWQSLPETRPFVPADYVLMWDALRALRKRMTGARPRFVEWGSGMGHVTLMASALGWRATGIEIDPDLVRESRKLSREFDLPAAFLEGSFFPFDPNAIEDLARICGQADVIYVYPWPDHEVQIFDLFDRLANPGCYFLAYYGIEDVRLFQKPPAATSH